MAPTASTGELRVAYLARARSLHPDRRAASGDSDAGPMQELNAAWEVLSDPARRADYDRTLRDGRREQRRQQQAARRDTDLDGTPWAEPGEPREPGPVPRAADDLVGFVLRSLPVIVLLGVLFLIFVVTAFAGGGGPAQGG